MLSRTGTQNPLENNPYRGLRRWVSSAKRKSLGCAAGLGRPDFRGADADAGAGPEDKDECQDGSGSGRTPTASSTRPLPASPGPSHPRTGIPARRPKAAVTAVGSQVRPTWCCLLASGYLQRLLSSSEMRCSVQIPSSYALDAGHGCSPRAVWTLCALWLERRAPKVQDQPILQISFWCLPPFFIFKKSFRKHFRLTRKVQNEDPELLAPLPLPYLSQSYNYWSQEAKVDTIWSYTTDLLIVLSIFLRMSFSWPGIQSWVPHFIYLSFALLIYRTILLDSLSCKALVGVSMCVLFYYVICRIYIRKFLVTKIILSAAWLDH